MKKRLAVVMIICFQGMLAADQGLSLKSLNLAAPVLQARLSLGFNYDFLRPPTDVSFDYAKGFFGFNIPVEQSINPLDVAKAYNSAIDSVFADSALFVDGNQFQPKASARQSPNTTVRVDVPMLGGVGSFSNVQNVYLNYYTMLGLPSFMMDTSLTDQKVGLLMRGAISVPIDLTLSWESMTFGYAYRVNRDIAFAFNLNRHVFTMDMRAKMDVSLLGYADVNQDLVSARIPMNYSLSGAANAHYDAEAWSPSFGIKLWRFTLTSRFGVNAKARGDLRAAYTLPFFVDKETFKPSIGAQQLLDPTFINRLQANDTTMFQYSSDKDMTWKLPDAHTIAFDLIRDKLNLSYTKMVGSTRLALDNVWRYRGSDSGSAQQTPVYDTLNLDLQVPVDNVILLSGAFHSAFFNVGVFTLDFQYADQANILSDAVKKTGLPSLGGDPMVPVLNFGSTLGTKMQLLLELDVLPLLAVKTGIYYYF